MKITALNIGRGFYAKLDAIEAMMKTEDIHVLGLSEVDLQIGDPVPIIPGYESFQQITNGKIRVLSYVKDGIPAKQFETNAKMPVVFLEVGQLSVGFIYNDFTQDGKRVTGSARMQRLQEMIVEFERSAKKSAALIGDFNIRWDRKSEERTFLSNWAAGAGFLQMIEEPTRSAVVDGRVQSSQIDLVFGRGKVKSAWAFDPVMSDHKAISCQVSRDNKAGVRTEVIIEQKVTMEVVRWARENPPAFSEDDSLDVLYNTLKAWMTTINEKCGRERVIKIGERKKPSWYTEDLEHMKKLVAILKGEERRKARNEYVARVKKAKRKFQRKRLEGSRRGVWEIVKRSHSKKEIELKEEGVKYTGKDAAEKLADFFENKPKKLRRQPQPDRVWDLLRGRVGRSSGSWDLKEISEDDLRKVIDRLKPKKSVGPDGISYLMIKQFKFEILPILLKIINKSVTGGQFVQEWKVGRIIPLYKGKGSRVDTKSYRPITLTSSIGRVIEMVVREQLETYLEENNILSPGQYGFRKGKGTSSCLVDCLDDIRGKMASGQKVGVIALDATAAFEVIDRPLLKKFIRMCGAGDRMMQWMDNYFDGRMCFVEVQQQRSRLWELELGSIQGGPTSTTWYSVMSLTQTLFNDFTSSYGFADDENEVVCAPTAAECRDLMVAAASGMVEWFGEVGLTLNEKKSEIVCFNFEMKPLEIAGYEVIPKKEFKFLGLTIQTNLRWGSHIEQLCASIRRAAGRIRLEGRHLQCQERAQLYAAWVGGRIHSNGRAYLPSISEGEANRLQAACNAAVRAVGGIPKKSEHSVTVVRKKYGIMSVREVKEFYELMEAWEMRDKLVMENVDRRETRSVAASKIVVPDQRGWRKFQTGTIARLSWNRLPMEVRLVGDRVLAKKMIKELVMK